MIKSLYCFFAVFLYAPIFGVAKDELESFGYFLLLKDVMHSAHSHTPRIKNDESSSGASYGEEFLELFHESLQDGFFGGVKWGIAACFYQLLYELSSGLIAFVPASISCIKHLCISCFDTLCGRPGKIRVEDLSVLAHLFHNVMQESVLRSPHVLDEPCSMFHSLTITRVCQHLIRYLQHHKKHYVDVEGEWTRIAKVARVSSLDNTNDIAFIIELLIHNLTCILECIEYPDKYHDISSVSHMTLHTFQTLRLLLQRDNSPRDNPGVLGAWFSNTDQRKSYEDEV